MSFTRACPTVAFAIAMCGAVVAAQTPQQPPPPTAQADQKAAPSPGITVSGCVQKESAVLKRNPAAGDAGMGDEFVLTFAALNVAGEAPKPDAKPAEPAAPSGAPGSFGTVYRVTGDKENELKALVGQRVEIAGNFKDKDKVADAISSVGTSGRNVELTPANTPEITIESIKPLTGTCSPAIK